MDGINQPVDDDFLLTTAGGHRTSHVCSNCGRYIQTRAGLCRSCTTLYLQARNTGRDIMTGLSTERTCVREEFLSCTTGGSDKGYVLRIYTDNIGGFHFYTNYGPRASGMTRNRAAPKFFNNMSACERDFERKLSTELGKGYVRCRPEFIGERSELNATVIPAAETSQPAAPTILWVPMLFTTADEARAQAAINDPTLIFQRKYDGERLRLAANAEAAITGCNRRGISVPVSPGLRSATARLFQNTGRLRFDLDGEILGTNEYVMWDNTINGYDQPYETRFRQVLTMAPHVPREITIADTAFSAPRKAAMLEQARREGWEGIMIKKRFGVYTPFRSTEDWKYPFTANVTVRLMAVNATSTTDHGSAAMQIRTGADSFVNAGNVSGGFARGELQTLAGRLQNGEIVLADIRYKNWTGSALYQPKFERYRTDLDWAQCIVTELRGPRSASVPVRG